MEIRIDELQCGVRLGCTQEERAFPQLIEFNLVLKLASGESLRSDRLSDTVDYMAVISAVQHLAHEEEFALLEKLAARVGEEILALSDKVEAVWVEVKKRISPVTKQISFSLWYNRTAA